MTYDTQDLYGKVEASWKMVIRARSGDALGGQTGRDHRIRRGAPYSAAGAVPPPAAKSAELIQTEGVKPIQVDKKKGEPR